MSPIYDVFLSHSSADKPAVEEIALKLREAGIEPFLDKWHLVPGELWQPGLEEGLRNSRACIVFVGSEGIGPLQRQEMLVAIDRGAKDPDFRVIPVLLPGSRKPTGIPDFLAQRTWVEFPSVEDENAFRRLLRGIRDEEPQEGEGEAPAKRSTPYRCMAQPPEGWIHRREYDEVLEALCSEEGAQAGRSVGITTALRGAGGFGKTALAQKLCCDERVREAYPDGILWATMGEDLTESGRLSRIRDLIRWWTQEEAPAFESVAAAGAHLRDLLVGSRVLVVIDDAWKSADVTPFQGLGNGSALLVTTRMAQALPEGSLPIPVDAMASSEAISLLGLGLPDASRGEMGSLAARLGEWALLLKLVNGTLRKFVKGGLSVPEALQRVHEDLDAEGFSAFDQNDSESRHAAASKTILVSTKGLSEKERDLFLGLAIFPEDEDIPLSVLERYWGLKRSAIRRLCDQFYDLSLLRAFDQKQGLVRLHDVTRQILMEQRREALSALHRRLLDLSRPASGEWKDIPEGETYLWRRLSYHLLGAEKKDELRALLLSFPFLSTKLKVTDINSLIGEYEPFVGEDQGLRLVQSALRLSAHVLANDRAQLASQLFGRLLSRKEPGLHALLEEARSWRGSVWLRPRTGSLAQAGDALIRTLEGHTDEVSAVAVLDGSHVVSGSEDGMLRVWDLEGGKILQILEEGTGAVTAVAVLAAGRIISGYADCMLRVWDLKSGQTIQTLAGHRAAVTAVAVLAGGHVVSGSDDGMLRVWDLESGQTLKTLKGHRGPVFSIAVLAEGRAVSGSWDGTLRVWNLETSQTLKILEGHTDGVTTVAALSDRRAVSGSDDGTLRVWDLESGQTLQVLEGHTGQVTAVAELSGGRAVSGSGDGTLRVWDLKSGQTLQTLAGHSDWINAVAVLSDGRAVSGSDDGTLRVWDLESSQSLQTFEGHTDGVSAVVVLSDNYAVSGSDDRTLRVWSLESGRPFQILEGHMAEVDALAVLASGRVISGSSDNTLRVWDLESGQSLQTFAGHTGRVSTLAVLAGGRVISGSSDKTLRVWDLESGQSLQIFAGHTGGVKTVAVLSTGRVVSGSSDETLRVWDLESGKSLQTLTGHRAWVNIVAVLSPDRAISGSSDDTLCVWDLESGRPLQTLRGHREGVSTLTMLADGRAVSGSWDWTLRVWDLESGKELSVMTLDAPVWSVAASPDGKIIVAGDQSGKLHFFDLVNPE
jgi:WD40 repeat protein